MSTLPELRAVPLATVLALAGSKPNGRRYTPCPACGVAGRPVSLGTYAWKCHKCQHSADAVATVAYLATGSWGRLTGPDVARVISWAQMEGLIPGDAPAAYQRPKQAKTVTVTGEWVAPATLSTWRDSHPDPYCRETEHEDHCATMVQMLQLETAEPRWLARAWWLRRWQAMHKPTESIQVPRKVWDLSRDEEAMLVATAFTPEIRAIVDPTAPDA